MGSFTSKFVVGQKVRIGINNLDGVVLGVLFRKAGPPINDVQYAKTDGDVRQGWFHEDELTAID